VALGTAGRGECGLELARGGAPEQLGVAPANEQLAESRLRHAFRTGQTATFFHPVGASGFM
jgi:hypothetical protein